jgi:hypothetical protein
MIRRALTLSLLVAVTVSILAAASAQARSAPIAAARYHGRVRCTGSDRFSNGAANRRYRSSPAVSVQLGKRQRVKRWTYLFLGRQNLFIQSRAVRVGQSFTYAAGMHIGRPGRTRVTVVGVIRASGRVEILARLDWSSPATGYIGSGTYDVMFERDGASKIRYDAVKVVVKLPLAGPTASAPVVRRNEHCAGSISR